MEVRYDPAAPRLTLGQTYFSPAMLVNPSQETKEYYERVLFSLNRAITNGGDQVDPALSQALEELRGVSW